MNVIVLVNMLIMLLVIVYLIASILLTIYWAVMIVNLLSCLALDPINCAAGVDQLIDYPGLYDDRGDLGTILSDIDMGLSLLESGVALLSPWAGTAAALDATSDFKIKGQEHAIGVSLSANNIPDPEAITSVGMSTKAEYGLPVTHEHLGNDCAHIIEIVTSMIGDGIKGIFGGGKGTSKILGMLNGAGGIFAGSIQWYYCSTDPTPPFPLPSFVKKLAKYLKKLPIREMIGGGDNNPYWEKDGYGPMENFKHKNVVGDDNHIDLNEFRKATKQRDDAEQKNGADHNQSYSFVLTPGAYNDMGASKNIGVMQLQHEDFLKVVEDKPTTIFYFAQAELYFDCTKGWRSPDCDQLGGFDQIDMTMYRFEWRARLVKFHAPAGGLADALKVINKVLGMVTDVKGYINGGASNPFIKALKFLDAMTGIDFIGMIGQIADMPPDQIFH